MDRSTRRNNAAVAGVRAWMPYVDGAPALTSQGPYRDLAHMPPEVKRPPSPASIARRASVRSVLPLWTLAAAFLLPAAKDCSEPKSPLHFASENVGMASWIAPPFIAAFALGVITLAAIVLRRSPRRASFVASFLLMVACLAPAPAYLLATTDGHPFTSTSGWDYACLLGYAATLFLASAWLLLATRKRGWMAWHGVLGALAWMALPVGAILTMSAFSDGLLVPGAIAYSAALFALLGIRTLALVSRVRRKRAMAAQTHELEEPRPIRAG